MTYPQWGGCTRANRRSRRRSRTLIRFRRAIERRDLWFAEDAARELPNLPLEDALQLVHVYAERGFPKYERPRRADASDP